MFPVLSQYFDSLCGLAARIVRFTPKCFFSAAVIPDLSRSYNPLNAKLNPNCHFLALVGAHHILHVSTLVRYR